jgi:hypothetical protein
MAATPSTMLALGTLMPDFELPDFTGKLISSASFSKAPASLVVFLCPHCPFVRHTRLEIGRFGRDYQERGLAMFAINPNDVGAFPEDGLEGTRRDAPGGRNCGIHFSLPPRRDARSSETVQGGMHA